jgi:signal transduction histidine kinase
MKMNKKPIQVLLFEDNPGDARLLREFLREDDPDQFALIQAERLETGLKQLTHERPDVILLDLGLPDSQGLATFTKVYAQAPDVPIVILTGLNDTEQAVRAVKAGAEDYLVKGEFGSGLIVRSIRYAIERKQAEEALQNYNVHLETEVTERTRELREAQERLIRQEKLAVLGQLAGGVSHELRNPLAVIKNSVYYLKLVQPEANEKIKQYHAMIDDEVRNAERIITDLLDFARVKSVDREPVSVPELLRRVLERFPVPDSVTVSLDFPADLPKVFVDPRQVEQVLGNLVVNACQAMKDGGRLLVLSRLEETVDDGQLTVDGKPSIPFGHDVVRRPASIVISVKDTGLGIAPENMQKLFEPLFTTKAKGIGLGLAVSQKLVEANGGRIEVESELGVGSTFTLYLPVKS